MARKHSLRHHRRLLAAMIASCFAAPALALPTGAQVAAGAATLSQAGNLLTINNSANAILNWQRFSIAANEAVRFNQPSAASSVLNRVTGADPSSLLGQLSSNGRVWLVNPAGILVGPGARIDTAGFVASTLNISNDNFLAGRLTFGGNAGAGNIINQGTITTPAGGSVYLIAPNVANEGAIATPSGETILAAGQSVQLIDTATPGVKVEITGQEGNATNLGSIVAEAGRIGMAGVLVRNSGTLNASSVVHEGGRIFLKATQDTHIDQSARVLATGTQGGSIEALGNRVTVTDDAHLDASGQHGGGSILVGGDFQGKNPAVQNAAITHFGPMASLAADALDNGDGGKVIVWADGTTRAYGNISARGGANGGDGGFVEVSGKETLDFRGHVDTSAPQGKIGTLLLDPATITIVNGAGPGTLDDSPPTVNAGTADSGGNTIAEMVLESQAANVLLEATGQITLDNLADDQLNMSNLTSGESITIRSTTSGGIRFTDVNDRIVTAGGNVVLDAQGLGSSIDIGGVWSGGGAVTMSAATGLVVREIVTTPAASGSGGNVALTSGGVINVTGYGIDAGAGNISLDAAGLNQAAGAILRADGLKVVSSGDVTLQEGNLVNKLAADMNTGGNLGFRNAQALAIDTVGGISGINFGYNTGMIDIKTTSGDLTVNQNVTASPMGGGAITLEAADKLNLNAVVASSFFFGATPGGPVKLIAGSSGIDSTAAAGIQAASLSVSSGGPVNLDTAANNQVSTLAAAISGSGDEYFYFKNTGALSIGTVGVISGIGITNIAGNYTAGSSDGVIALDTTGDLTQTTAGGLAGAAVWAKSSGGSVALDTVDNPAGVLAGFGFNNFSYKSSSPIALENVAGHTGVSSLTGGSVTLSSPAYSISGFHPIGGASSVVLTAGDGINLAVHDATSISAINGSVGVPANHGVSITSTSSINAGLSLQVDQTLADAPMGVTAIVVRHNGAITASGNGIISRNVAQTSGGDIYLSSTGPNADAGDRESMITASAASPIKTLGSGLINLVTDEIDFPINAVSADTTHGLVAIKPNNDAAWALDTAANCAALSPCYDITSLQSVSANTLYLGDIDGSVTGNLSINGPVAFTNRLVGIGTWGTVAHAGTGSISANTLAIHGQSGIGLDTNANTVNEFAAYANAGNIAFTNSQSLTIPASITDPGNTYRGGIYSGGGNVTLSARAGDINIPSQIDAGTGSVSLTATTGKVYGSGTSPSIIAGTVSVTANGPDAANPAIGGADGLHIQSPNIALTAPAGSIDVRTTQATTLNGASASGDITVIPAGTAHPLSIDGTVSAGGSITLVGSDITQNANVTTTARALPDFVSVSATTGNIVIAPAAVTSTGGAPIYYDAPNGTVSYVAANFSGVTPQITQQYVAPGPLPPPPTVDECTANPSLSGCSNVLPSLDTCTTNPTAAGCTAVLPSISTCTADPTAAGCTAVLPSLSTCNTNPTAAGCTAVLPSPSNCSTDPTLPGCATALPTVITNVTTTAVTEVVAVAVAATSTTKETATVTPSPPPPPLTPVPTAGTTAMLLNTNQTIGGTEGSFGGATTAVARTTVTSRTTRGGDTAAASTPSATESQQAAPAEKPSDEKNEEAPARKQEEKPAARKPTTCN